MKLRASVTAAVLVLSAVIFMAAPIGQAAERVRLVDNLVSQKAQVEITSSTSSSVDMRVDVDAISIKPDADWEGDYRAVDLPDGDAMVAGKMTEIGDPELPVMTTLIAIPDNAGVRVTADYESFEIIDDVDVLPVQVPMLEGGFDGLATFAKNNDTYSQNDFYPDVLAEAGEPAILRDVRVVQVSVYPVHYNPVTRQLKVFRNISVDITYDGEVVNPKTIRHDYISEAFYPIYKSFIANFDQYMSTLTNNEVKRGGVLIITPNIGNFMWEDEMQEVANWKRRKGYDVVLATTYDVDPSDGRPSQTQIKSYIVSAYENWEIPPDFVYLIGDEDLQSGGYVIPDYPYSSYPSDHQYACLEGSDYLPEVAVCRVAVDNTNELNAWIAKVMKYEKDPLVDTDPDWWRRGLMVAGGNQTETCPWTVLTIGERLMEHGFVHVDTVIERNYNDPPDYLMSNPITAGVGYVNYRGWAGSDGWWDPSFNLSALGQCQNIDKPGIMTSIVCGTGDFGTNVCFGEQWIRMGTAAAPRGGPCFMGCTDHFTHTKWNNPISYGFYQALLEQGIYHFGTAAVAGKLRQFECYPREYSQIQQYFHTYNMLGDPELEMRLTTPIPIVVDHPAALDAGINHLEVTVTYEDQQPVEDAYVTLLLGEGADEAFFAVTKTDASGFALLPVPVDTTGELQLTVTGRDLFPYLGTVDLAQADEAVGIEASSFDDDMSGGSYGNDDGAINPTETIELSVELKNFGSAMTAENTNATLVSMDENLATVQHAWVHYGQLAPGQTSTGNGMFVFTVEPGTFDGEDMTFRLDVTTTENPDGWSSYIHLPVAAAKFSVTNVTISDNNRLDPDETADVTLEISNVGQLDVTGLHGTLQTADGYVHTGETIAEFGDIAMGETGENSGSPFSVSVDAGTFEGKNVPFVLNLVSADGATYTANFNLTVGVISASDPAGPDAYGYYVYDNTDTSYPEAPTYQWMDIHTLGTDQNMYDDSRKIITLPFDFVYYNETHSIISICSNGWICMDSTQWVGFRNFPLPDPSNAHATLAGFWDDLGPSGANDVYTYYDTDNNRFIIEWYNVVARWNSGVHETFQIILYDPAFHQTITGDGPIEYVYNAVTNNHGGSGENYASIGWENYNELIGFSISYSNYMTAGCASLSAGRVFRITPNTGRGGAQGMVEVTGGDVSNVRVMASTGQWTTAHEDGNYSLREIPPGTPDLTFSKDGWFPQMIGGVNITANSFTNGQNATLEMCPIPTDLEASEGLNDHVHVTWTEVNHPDLSGYDIYRGRWQNGIYSKLNDMPVSGGSYDDYTTEGDNIYWYYVKAVYEGAGYEAISLSSDRDYGSNADVTGIDEQNSLPQDFSLSQNYPNPFNANTVINYALPVSGQVSLDIFNILGQKVNSLFDGYQQAGYRSLIWNGRDASGNSVASGIYFYRLTTPETQITKRMLMLK